MSNWGVPPGAPIPPQQQEPVVGGLSQWERVADTFTAPQKTFDDIKRGNRSWWLPLIIAALFTYFLFGAIVAKVGVQQVVENQIRMSPKTQEQLAQAPPERREMSNKISVWITEGAFIGGPLLGLIAAAVVSLVFWGTINFVFGGRANFGSIFAVNYYAWLPSIVKVVLGVVVMYAGMAPESFNVKNYAPTNLGAFMDPMEANKALYSLATSLDIVTIWTLVLMSIGVATVAGVKRSSGYITVFGWWVIIVLLGVGMAAVRG